MIMNYGSVPMINALLKKIDVMETKGIVLTDQMNSIAVSHHNFLSSFSLSAILFCNGPKGLMPYEIFRRQSVVCV
jgi:hypothetical protein